jgi:hypothetical protein
MTTKTTTPTDRILWRCRKCLKPVIGDTGYVGASFQQIRDRGPIRWFVSHDECFQDDDTYSIDCVRIATVEDIDWWTCHLRGKNWYDWSDWSELVARVAPGHSVPSWGHDTEQKRAATWLSIEDRPEAAS